MAGYVKIWTTIRTNHEFLSLSLSERGIYLQLIIIAKDQRDDGKIAAKMSGLCSDCGCDVRTLNKSLTKLSQKCMLTFKKSDEGVVEVRLPNYKQWQEFTVNEVVSRERKNVANMRPTRAEQSKPDQTRAEQGEKELLQLSILKIRVSYFRELCKEFPTVDHQEELKCADLYRQSKPGKGKGNDHLFLRNWFKNNIKFQGEKNDNRRRGMGKSKTSIPGTTEEFSKYKNGRAKWPEPSKS